jgi:endonuclease V-like protein UPF0215 family
MPGQPRVLGIDDAPFTKGQDGEVPIVGVVVAGAKQVEGVAITSFPVDGEGATAFLIDWVRASRWNLALQGIVLGGITIAGLGLVDIVTLAADLATPVLAVTRRPPAKSDLGKALATAGLMERVALLERTPSAIEIEPRLHLAFAGIEENEARKLLRSTLGQGKMPEALRLAHLIGAALVHGQSKGRV